MNISKTHTLVLPIVMVFSLISEPVFAATKPTKITKVQCQKLQAKIDKLDSQLRQRQTAAKSEKLKRRLADAKNIRYQCMKKRYKTS